MGGFEEGGRKEKEVGGIEVNGRVFLGSVEKPNEEARLVFFSSGSDGLSS